MSGRLVFDGSVLSAQPTGVGRAFLTTLAAYARIAERPLTLIAPHTLEVPGVECVVRDVRGLARHTVLPRLLRELDAALLHAPIAALPLVTRCPCIATIHDLPWRARLPRGEPGCRVRDRIAMRMALARAWLVLVPSYATARELGARAHVRIVPHGVVAPAEPAPSDDLAGPFLVLGDARPRKNLERVAAAHKMARAMDQELPGLRIAGPVHGWVSEDEKVRLLRSSRALVNVSLLEGFGLPPLEAMAHGLPVLCSDRGSLPEIAGDAALTCDALDVPAIARALVRMHRDEELRTQLRRRGLARAALFTPERSAAGWLAAHREILR